MRAVVGYLRCTILFEEDTDGLFTGTGSSDSTQKDKEKDKEKDKDKDKDKDKESALGLPPLRYAPDRAKEDISVELLTVHIARFQSIIQLFTDWVELYVNT